MSTAHAKSFQSAAVFTSRSLVTASNNGDSSNTPLLFTDSRTTDLQLTLLKSKSHCDWRSVSQSVSLGVEPDYYLTVTVLFLWGSLSLTRGRVCLIYAAGPCQLSISRGRDPWDSRPYFTVSDFRLQLTLQSRAEQSSSLLPATCQQGHSWHRAPLGPMAIYLFSVKTFCLTTCLGYNISARTA
jgi:hypothetical protein